MNYDDYIKKTDFNNIDPMSAIAPMIKEWLKRAGYCSVTYPLVYDENDHNGLMVGADPSLAFVLRGYNRAEDLPSYIPHKCYQVWEKYYPEMIHAFRAYQTRWGDYTLHPWVNQDNNGYNTHDVINNRWLVIVYHNQNYYPDGDIHVFDMWNSNKEVFWEDLLESEDDIC